MDPPRTCTKVACHKNVLALTAIYVIIADTNSPPHLLLFGIMVPTNPKMQGGKMWGPSDEGNVSI